MTSEEDLYAVATRNRLLAAEMFAGLTEAQWATPSLCDRWTVREVLAHLVPPEGGLKVVGLAWDVLRFRGDLERMVDETAREKARKVPTETLVAQLRDRAGVRLDPPVVGPGGPMTDTAIHLRDVARPLGLDVNPPAEDWGPVLEWLVSKPATKGFMPRRRLAGLRLVATDLGWTWGTGAELRGTAEAVAMGISGRASVLPDLGGKGVAVLTARLFSE